MDNFEFDRSEAADRETSVELRLYLGVLVLIAVGMAAGSLLTLLLLDRICQ